MDTMKVTYGGENSPASFTTSMLSERSASRDVAWHTCGGKRGGGDGAWRECTVTFSIDRKLQGPLQVYYGVENMYQNNLGYSTKASYPQLRGEKQDTSQLRIPCSHGYLTGRDDAIYWPCGLMANTMFTDRFELVSPDVIMSQRDISWPTDADYMFKNPKNWKPNSTISGYFFVDEAYASTPYAREFAREGLENEVRIRKRGYSKCSISQFFVITFGVFLFFKITKM